MSVSTVEKKGVRTIEIATLAEKRRGVKPNLPEVLVEHPFDREFFKALKNSVSYRATVTLKLLKENEWKLDSADIWEKVPELAVIFEEVADVMKGHSSFNVADITLGTLIKSCGYKDMPNDRAYREEFVDRFKQFIQECVKVRNPKNTKAKVALFELFEFGKLDESTKIGVRLSF